MRTCRGQSRRAWVSLSQPGQEFVIGGYGRGMPFDALFVICYAQDLHSSRKFAWVTAKEADFAARFKGIATDRSHCDLPDRRVRSCSH